MFIEHIVNGLVLLAGQLKANQPSAMCRIKRNGGPEGRHLLRTRHPARSEIEEPPLNVLDSYAREEIDAILFPVSRRIGSHLFASVLHRAWKAWVGRRLPIAAHPWSRKNSRASE